MQNVVNKANFTNYPLVLQMINRCEKLFQEVSERLMQEGKDGLYEDERLFINMINRLNQQVLNTADGEGAAPPERKESQRGAERVDFSAASQNETSEMKTLRSLVEEHDARASAAQVSELEGMDERKRPADGPLGRDAKQRKL